jgi:hypothetical protein
MRRSRRQETGDRRQETGDRRQETGDRRQETGILTLTGGTRYTALLMFLVSAFENGMYCSRTGLFGSYIVNL